MRNSERHVTANPNQWNHAWSWLDRTAVGLATLCAIHCLLTPLLLVALPILGTTFLVDENFHLWMAGLVLPTTGIAVLMGCRRHKDWTVAGLSLLGLALLFVALAVGHGPVEHHHAPNAENLHPTIAAAFVHEHNHASPLNAESLIMTLAGILLACGHVRNYRLCRSANCDHDGSTH